MTTEIEFRYFSSVKGRAVKRFGTDTWIGCKRGLKGFVWDTDKVVAIPASEVLQRNRDYITALRDGDLVERKKSEAAPLETPPETPEKSTSDSAQVDDGANEGSDDQSDSQDPEPTRKRGGGRRRRS